MNCNIHIPQTWNELTERQLQQIALGLEYYRALPDDKQNTGLQLKKLYIHLIKNLIRENGWFKVRIALRQIPPNEYVDYFKFILQGNKRTKFPKKIRLKKKDRIPPENRLQDITAGTFSFADSLFYRYRQNPNPRFLNLLCATLYRPKGQAFNKIDAEKQAVHWQKVKRSKKLAILYAYEGGREYITSLYPKIFSKQEEEEKKGTQKYTPFGRLIHYKVGFDPYKLEQVENLNIHKFFSIYQNELVEIQKQKQYGR